MRPVFERLDELGIAPGLRDDSSVEDDSLIKGLEEIVAKFDEDEEEELEGAAMDEIAAEPPPAAHGRRFERKEVNEAIGSVQSTISGDTQLKELKARGQDFDKTEELLPQPRAIDFKSKSPFAPYVAYEGSHVDDPRSVSAETVAEGLCRIIEIEGPMLAKRAYDIYLRGCGIKRLGHELRSTMNKALQVAIRQGRVISEDESGKGGLLLSVIRIKGSPPIKLRSRGTRTFEEIPPSELQTVARYLAEQHGLESGSDDHLRAILDNFDLKRLTTQVGKSLLEILEKHYSYIDEHLNKISPISN